MKALLCSLLCASAAFAHDWKTLARDCAKVDLVHAEFEPLIQGQGKDEWASVPAALIKNAAVISKPGKNMGGTLDFQIARDGWVWVTGTFGYEGNAQGDWDELRWDAKQFKAHGWQEFGKSELDGELSKDGKEPQPVFGKRLKKGDWFRIRTNKYSTPAMILFGPQPPMAPLPTPAKPPQGFDYDALAKQPAHVDAPGFVWRKMAEGRGQGEWVHLPLPFQKHGAQATSPDPALKNAKGGPPTGAIDFKVKQDGWVLVACQYDYQGNKSGDWLKERWEPADFKKHGWKELEARSLGFPVIGTANELNYIFAKFLKAGETQRLRCNKYGAPKLITLGKSRAHVLPAAEDAAPGDDEAEKK